MEEKIELLKKGILEQIPQIPYVVDQVGDAIEWCIEGHDEGVVVKTLEASLDVAHYVKDTSDRNFYKTQYLVASLIGDIPNVLEDERFEKFKTTSGATEKAIKSIKIDDDLVQKRGCFNALSVHITNLARNDEDGLVVALYGILHDIKDIVSGIKKAGEKSALTPQDYITVLGYAYVMTNLRMANLNLLETTRSVVNEISIILNHDIIY